MTTAADITGIMVFLEKEFSCAQSLCDILQSERDALAGNQLDKLNDLSVRKQELVEELESQGRQRIAWLQAHGVVTDTPGMNDFFSSTGKACEPAWNSLLSQLETCQQLNRVNGSIVEQLQRKIRDALAIIQGKPADTDLYDQSGKTSSGTTAGILTRA